RERAPRAGAGRRGLRLRGPENRGRPRRQDARRRRGIPHDGGSAEARGPSRRALRRRRPDPRKVQAMIKAVFFDAGHTLLYAHPDIGTVYSQATASFGVELAPERFAETFVPVFKETTKIYSQMKTASDSQDLEMWRDITRRIYDRLPPLAG